jgi:hypothetical protein
MPEIDSEVHRALGRIEGKMDVTNGRQAEILRGITALEKRVTLLERSNDYSRGIRVSIAASVGALITMVGYSFDAILKWFGKS